MKTIMVKSIFGIVARVEMYGKDEFGIIMLLKNVVKMEILIYKEICYYIGYVKENNPIGFMKVFNKELKLEVKGKSVLVVDDIFTTGATSDEIAKVLMKAGAKEVNVLTLAHAVVEENNKK